MFFHKKKHFLHLSGAAFIAVIALIFAAAIFFLLLPHIVDMSMVVFVLVLIFVLIWLIIYVAMVVGAAVYRYAIPTFQAEEPQYQKAGRKSRRKR